MKQWLAFGLSLGLLASCSQDRSEPSPSVQGGGDTVTLSLSAEVSVDDSELRAINYTLGKNANGKVVPMPQFKDGELVDVHTVVKGSSFTIATLKWRYDAKSNKLVLQPKVKDASGKEYNNELRFITSFNNDGGTKWYISALIGGKLSVNRIRFEGTRVLNGVTRNEGEALGALNVPYALGWTELTIDTNSPKSGNSYSLARIPESAKSKFVPLGSLIAYELGNQQVAGDYTFTPEGFTITSNAFGDQGEFIFNTSGNTPSVLPEWNESVSTSSMNYTFSKPQSPIAKGASHVYYAWVMQHKVAPTRPQTEISVSGQSSRDLPSGLKIKEWILDYAVKGTKLVSSKVYTLKVNVTTLRPILPIEYVIERNLAGGEGLTYTAKNYNTQPRGVTGSLRLADSDANDQSGYYNWYRVVGEYHTQYNSQSKSLQNAVDEVFGKNVYVIPTIEQIWSIWPSNTRYHFDSNTDSPNVNELMAFGSSDNLIRQSYLSDYSKGFGFQTNEAVIYAIRFKKRDQGELMTYNNHTYPSSTGDLFKCAYRFTRIGDFSAWNQGGGVPTWYLPNANTNLTNHFRIDVIYLGEEISATTLSDISSPVWWEKNKEKIISRIFPATGDIIDDPEGKGLRRRGVFVTYWPVSTSGTETGALNAYIRYDAVLGDFKFSKYIGKSVRLFHNQL